MRNKEEKVIGIDPGFDRVGVAVLAREDGREILLHSECIGTDPKQSHHQRLCTIGKRVDEVIKEWRPRVMAVEKLFFNRNISSALGVAEARGVIIFQAARAGLEVFEYSPQEAKIAVTGYGKADKNQMEIMIRKLVKVPDTDKKRLDDEMDAIAMGITHLATHRGI